MSNLFFYIGGVLPLLWGISHLFPTKNVVNDFGDISRENKLIITMEWITEGIALIFIGALTILITLIDPTTSISTLVFLSIVAVLNILSLVSIFTGARINFLPFRLCPFVFSGASVLILLGLLF